MHLDQAPYIVDYDYNQKFLAFCLTGLSVSNDIKQYIEHFVYHEIRKYNETSKSHYSLKIPIQLQRGSSEHLNITLLESLEFQMLFVLIQEISIIGILEVQIIWEMPIILYSKFGFAILRLKKHTILHVPLKKKGEHL